MNKAQALPQYRQVADTLRRRIDNGVYRQGDTLPPHAELERSFEVSSITVRKALGILSAEGRVTGRRGVGTVVMPPPADARVTIRVSGNFREWLESASGQDLPIKQEVLDIAVVQAPSPVARTLSVPDSQPLWRMRRRRRIHGVPISYHINYGRPETFGHVTAAQLAPNRSFVDVMRTDLHLPLRNMDQRVEAITADRDLADLLDAAFGDPVFLVENRYRVDSGAVAAVTLLYLRGDRYRYQSSIPLGETEPPTE